MARCEFALPWIHYLGHTLSLEDIINGAKVGVVLQMPAPSNVNKLRSFFSSILREVHQRFGNDPGSAYTSLKEEHTVKMGNWTAGVVPASNGALIQWHGAHAFWRFAAHWTLLQCFTSWLGAVLFHRYPDGSNCSIANASRKMTDTQTGYNRVQREALSVIFGLK